MLVADAKSEDCVAQGEYRWLLLRSNITFNLCVVQMETKSKDSTKKRKLWSSGKALGSRLEGRGFDPYPMLDGSGVKAMPG